MNDRLSFALRNVCVLVLGTLLLSACGGRFQTVREVADDPDNGGSSNGGSANANAGRGGALSSRAGSSSAGWSSGATSNSGGASTDDSGGNCSLLKCPFPTCPAGSAPVIPAGGCCPVCQSICPPCAGVMCPSGSHAQVLDGCCPVCIPDDTAACMKGQRAYASFRNELLNKYQYGCASDAECTVIAPVNQCENGCGFTVVWYGVSDSFDANLSNAADMYCSTCAQLPVPPCAAPVPAACIQGQCQFAVPK